MSKAILIIGGTGFIGSYLVDFYLKKKFKVFSISLKKKKIKKKKNLKHFFFDISDKNKCSIFFKKYNFTYIINLAGYVDHSSFFCKNNKNIEYHLNGTLNTVFYINKKKLKKYLYIGSSDEYGLNKSPQDEKFREMPNSTYSFSKVASTHFLQMISRSEDFPTVILRIFLAYGPNQKKNRLIPQVIQGCLKNTRFKTSSGEQIRNFCYIDDVVRAIHMLLVSKYKSGEIYNVGSLNSYKIKTIINTIKSILKGGSPIFGKFTLRKNENTNLYPNITKIYKCIGWKPRINLNQGLKKTIQDFKNNART